MTLSDEIKKLADLRASGALSEEEFQQAKTKLLQPAQPTFYSNSEPQSGGLGRAANRYVSFQIFMSILVGIIFLLFIAPRMCSSGPSFGTPFSVR
jgi:hypothetical protein